MQIFFTYSIKNLKRMKLLLLFLLCTISAFAFTRDAINADYLEYSLKFASGGQAKFEPEAANAQFFFEGKKLGLSTPPYINRCRYYFDILDFSNCLGASAFKTDSKIHVKNGNTKITIDFKKSYYTKQSKSYKISKNIYNTAERFYISMFDLCLMFDLKTFWDLDESAVYLYKNREPVIQNPAPEDGKPAYVRLEDIAPGEGDFAVYSNAKELEKLRVVADYLYSESIPFHVAWIPRYINPEKNIDNDPSKKFSIYNIDFIFTLDYFTYRNGLIGLHGYTHQHDGQKSITGVEFTKDVNNTKELSEERIKAAINTAEKLEIPIAFFEFPHYSATAEQAAIAEKYFNIIYQPESYRNRNIVYFKKTSNGKTKYVPAPLGNMSSKNDIDRFVKEIDALPDETAASFFYHPGFDFDFIKTTRDGTGYPCYEYDEASPLHRAITRLEERGYKFIKVSD